MKFSMWLEALERDWWKNFHHHLTNSISLEFPEIVNFAHPNEKTEPALCVGKWNVTFANNEAPTSTFYRTSFGQRHITFTFQLSRLSHIYHCDIRLMFDGYIADKMQYTHKFSKQDTAFKKPIDSNFIMAQILIQRDLGSGRSKLIASNDINASEATPFNLVKKIRKFVSSDNDDEGGNNYVEPSPQPSNSKLVPA